MTSFDTAESSHADAGRAPDSDRLASLGDYDLIEVLGRGGMGTVYRAEHRRLGKSVAIKVLPAERVHDPASVSRFEREMRAVGQLDHPHIVQAYDAREEQGTHFLVMQLVRGVDVAAIVQRHGPLRVPDACEIVRQAALGLQYAHERGLVHRDIKPSNLLLAQNGIVKILDMGLALLSCDTHQGELTSTGEIMGTLDYIAPEQIASTHHVDIRADLYSLGCTLFKLLTGIAPFAGPASSNPLQKMRAHEREAPPPLTSLRPDLPAEVGAIVERLLAKDPDARYQTPQELADAIQPLCDGAELRTLIENLPPATNTQPAIPQPTASHVSRSGRTETVTSFPALPAAVDDRPLTGHELTFRPGTGTGIANRARRKKAAERRIMRASIGIGLLMLGGLGWLYGAQVIRIATSKGLLVIEADEREIEVTITRGDDDAPVIVKDKASDREYTLQMGADYRVLITEPATGAQFRSEQFSIVVGGKKVFDVRAELDRHVPKPRPPSPNEPKPSTPSPTRDMATRARPTPPPVRKSSLPCNTGPPPLEIEQLTREQAVGRVLELGGRIHVYQHTDMLAFDRRVESASQIKAEEWDHLGLWMERAETGDVSDDQLVSIIRALPGLRQFTTSSVGLTPRILPEVATLSRLQDIGLNGLDIRDDDLLLLHHLPRLAGVGFNSAGTITDAGLAHLVSHPNIGEFRGFLLHGQPVTDAGLIALFQRMPLAAAANLGRTGITDATLQAVADHPTLTTIHLYGTNVSDASIEALIRKQPRYLDLNDTQFTAAGIERLREALPACEIRWEPSPTVSQQEAIQQVLDWGGTIQLVNEERTQAEDVADPFAIAEADWPRAQLNLHGLQFERTQFETVLRSLPDIGYLSLDRSYLDRNSLSTVSRLPNLVHLTLSRTGVVDNDMQLLAQIPRLGVIGLEQTRVTDIGLRLLAANKALANLRFSGTDVTDAGVVPLVESREVLANLWLNDTDITDATLAALPKLPRPGGLQSLELQNTRITDAGLRHLHSLSGLKRLELDGNALSREAVEELQLMLPGCEITWDEYAERIPAGRWVDLIPLIDAEQDTVAGEWWVADGQLMSQTSKDILELPLIPYGDYELEVTLIRTSGNDAIAVNFPVGTGDTLFLLGGWGNKFGGFNMAYRRTLDHEENKTSRPGAIKNGQSYKLHLEVRTDGRDAYVTADVDGLRYTEFCGAQRDLETVSGFKLRNRAKVGFCQNVSGVTYQTARLRMLTGEARLLRQAGK